MCVNTGVSIVGCFTYSNTISYTGLVKSTHCLVANDRKMKPRTPFWEINVNVLVTTFPTSPNWGFLGVAQNLLM